MDMAPACAPTPGTEAGPRSLCLERSLVPILTLLQGPPWNLTGVLSSPGSGPGIHALHLETRRGHGRIHVTV